MVRGSTDPTKDCQMVGEDLVLIQPAKLMCGGKVSISYFEEKAQQHDEVGGPEPKRRKSGITHVIAQC